MEDFYALCEHKVPNFGTYCKIGLVPYPLTNEGDFMKNRFHVTEQSKTILIQLNDFVFDLIQQFLNN